MKFDKFIKVALFRYADRVKAETERIEQLELDDLKVVCLFNSLTLVNTLAI